MNLQNLTFRNARNTIQREVESYNLGSTIASVTIVQEGKGRVLKSTFAYHDGMTVQEFKTQTIKNVWDNYSRPFGQAEREELEDTPAEELEGELVVFCK